MPVSHLFSSATLYYLIGFNRLPSWTP